MLHNETLRIAVIGAGPVGIEAALYAKTLGFPVVVFERGEVADHLTRWGHVRLFTPFALNHTPLGADTIRKEHPGHQLPAGADLISGSDYRDIYLLPLALSGGLCDCIRMKTEVLHIGRTSLFKSDPPVSLKRRKAPFRILARESGGQEKAEEADIVLDCSGTYATHRWLGEGGIPALGELAAERHIAYGVPDILGAQKSQYAGKSVIVIGGGYSAATSVASLATLAEQNNATWIIWLNRGTRGAPLPRASADPLRERDRLAARANTLATRGEGHVEYHANTAIDKIECHGPDKGFRVTGSCAGNEMVWEVDRVIANVGYRPDLSICRELHVSEPDGKFGVLQPEPNYYLLGAKSLGQDSNFLLRNGFEQIRDVFGRIAGNPKLDLYGGKWATPARMAA